jgi:hypothetical protein
MDVYGIITAVDSPSTGWYLAEPSTAPGISVGGVSLKGTTLSLGQRVSIFQLGHWGDSINEFGFSESTIGLSSMTQYHPNIADGVMAKNNAQACAAYIAEKAGNHRRLYRPGTVQYVSGARLSVKDEWGNTAYFEQLAADITASDFMPGDRVLIGIWPNREPVVLGWWQSTRYDRVPFWLCWKVSGCIHFQKYLSRSGVSSPETGSTDYWYDVSGLRADNLQWGRGDYSSPGIMLNSVNAPIGISRHSYLYFDKTGSFTVQELPLTPLGRYPTTITNPSPFGGGYYFIWVEDQTIPGSGWRIRSSSGSDEDIDALIAPLMAILPTGITVGGLSHDASGQRFVTRTGAYAGQVANLDTGYNVIAGSGIWTYFHFSKAGKIYGNTDGIGSTVRIAAHTDFSTFVDTMRPLAQEGSIDQYGKFLDVSETGAKFYSRDYDADTSVDSGIAYPSVTADWVKVFPR